MLQTKLVLAAAFVRNILMCLLFEYESTSLNLHSSMCTRILYKGLTKIPKRGKCIPTEKNRMSFCRAKARRPVSGVGDTLKIHTSCRVWPCCQNSHWVVSFLLGVW